MIELCFLVENKDLDSAEESRSWQKVLLGCTFYEDSITLIMPDNDTTNTQKLQLNIPNRYKCKNPKQNFSKLNSIGH